MASGVSAVSGGVANGHQTVPHVSCAPSKIPYGGFSPVRLQTGIGRRPSSRRDLYAAKADESFRRGVLPVSGRSRIQSARRFSSWAIPSRGPWLARRFCCPAGSSLTMASSAPLAPSRRLICFVRRVFLPLAVGASEGPRFTPRVCSPVPSSLPRRSRRLLATIAGPPTLAFARLTEARLAQIPARRFSRGLVDEAAKFAIWARWPGQRGASVHKFITPRFNAGEEATIPAGNRFNGFRVPAGQ